MRMNKRQLAALKEYVAAFTDERVSGTFSRGDVHHLNRRLEAEAELDRVMLYDEQEQLDNSGFVPSIDG